MEIAATLTDGFELLQQRSAPSKAHKRDCDEFPDRERRHTENAHHDSPKASFTPYRNPQPSRFEQKWRTPSSYVVGTSAVLNLPEPSLHNGPLPKAHWYMNELPTT